MYFIVFFIFVFFVIVTAIFHKKNKNKAPSLKLVRWLPYPVRGMAIPPFGVFARKSFYSDKHVWLRDHEYEHWYQYQRMGLWKFYITYYLKFIRHGYFNHPMEREAREKGGWEDFVEKK